MVDDDHLGIVMADVSDKGVPAALFMMMSKIMIQNVALMGVSPGEALAAVNDQICSYNSDEMFVTVWLGVLELSTGRLVAANAGHEKPIVLGAKGTYELYRDRHGFVVGGIEGMEYAEYELTLRPGGRLFLYTDGLPEASDARGSMFGLERVLDVLNASVAADSTVYQVIDAMSDAVGEFVGDAPQFDDLTMLCLEYRGTTTPVGEPIAVAEGVGAREDAAGASEASATAAADVGADLTSRGTATAAREIRLRATPAGVEPALAFVGEAIAALDPDERTSSQLEVVVDELFSNIAQYAYEDGAGTVLVRVAIDAATRRVTLTFEDEGVPYDPTIKPDPDTTLGADEREVGGYGIFMVKQTVDSMAYERRDGKNVLTLTKRV